MQSQTEEMLLDALCHRQRLDLVGEITGAVAHDLNNALSVVNGNVELLLENLHEPDLDLNQLRQDARTACNWSSTAMAAAHRLLTFSRQLRSDHGVAAANDLAVDAVAMCRFRCELDGLRLFTDLDTEAGDVHVHAGQILQVLIAMLQNAREALVRGGDGGSIRVGTRAGGGQVRLEVEDDGPGIRADLGERVFEIGFTTKDDDPAAGLGLCLGRRIARAHGGDLVVETGSAGGLQALLLPRLDG